MRIFYFLIVLISSLTLQAQNLDSLLLLYYPFSGNANDASGNGFHGTVYNATLTDDRFGNPNKAYYFNGIDSHVEFPNITELKPPLPITLAFWIKLNDYADANTRVLTTSYSLDSYCGISVNTHGGIVGIGYGDGTPNSTGPQNRRSKSGTTVMQLNQWYFITLVIKGPQNMDLYINCLNDGGTYSGTGGSMAYSTNSGSLGRYDMWNLVPSYFFGKLDEIRYWSRALSADEVNKLCELTSIEESINSDLQNNLLLFPNPASNVLNITTEAFSGKFTYRIVNAIGETVNTGILQQTETHEINIDQLSSGIYILYANDDEKQYSQKFIKQ